MTAPTSSRRQWSAPTASGGGGESERLVGVLAQCALLFGMPMDQLEEVASVCTTVSIAPQEHVFAEGDPCGGLWVIAEGRVRLYHADAQGRQQVVSFRGPSDLLELAPALDGRAYSASALTLEECDLVYVPRATLASLGERFPVTIRNTMSQLCMEVRQRDIATAIASLRNARGRVLCTLLFMADQYGVRTGDGGVSIDYRLTRQDIADRSGVTLETSIRVLSDLQRRGLVRTRAQCIEILEVERLRTLGECGECELDCSVFAKPRPRVLV